MAVKVTPAGIREVARGLRADGEAITPMAIARRMDISESTVCSKIDGIRGLRADLEIMNDGPLLDRPVFVPFRIEFVYLPWLMNRLRVRREEAAG